MENKPENNQVDRSEGLTLLELLVALAIFGIIITGIVFYLMRTAQSTGRRVDVAVSVQQGTRLAMEQMTRELRQAGYHKVSDLAFGQGSGVTDATHIEFEADLAGSGTPQRIQYKLENGNLQRRVGPRLGSSTTADTCGGQKINVTWEDWVILAENVTNLTLSYLPESGHGTENSNPTCDQLQFLQAVRMVLAAQVNNPYPGGPPVAARLTALVQTRNSGIFGGCDTTAPGTPQSLTISDPCRCIRLNLSWTGPATSPPDMAGYTIYIGRTDTPGVYDSWIDVGNINSYVLDQYNANLRVGTTYHIAIAARDTCHNLSPALEVTGVANTGCGDGTLDTQPNPSLPEAVIIDNLITASVSPPPPGGTGQVTLGWGAVRVGGVITGAIRDDLSGYKIYRSFLNDQGVLQPFNLVGTVAYSGATTATYSYTDTNNLIGCRTYYYRIAAYNCVGDGPQSPAAPSAIFGNGTTGSPSGSINTTPRDNVLPVDPAPTNTAAGSRETWVRFTAPIPQVNVENDFFGVLILYRTGLPADDPNNPANYPPISDGTDPRGLGASFFAFSQTLAENANLAGTQVFHHGDGTAGSVVQNNIRYFYRVYAFDRCGNYSPGAGSSATALPCGDAEAGVWYNGAPPNGPRNLTATYCRTDVTLSWLPPVGNAPHQNDVPPDLMSYRIIPSNAATFDIPAGEENPSVSISLGIDPPPAPGTAISYQVAAVDCANNVSPLAGPITVYPGGVVVDLNHQQYFTTKGDNHNEVYFIIQNTSGTTATLRSLTMRYTQSGAYIKEVDFYYINGVDSNGALLTTLDRLAYSGTPPLKSSDNEVIFSNQPTLAETQALFPNNSYRLVKVVFTGSDGVSTSGADMRGIQFDYAKFTFFLNGNAGTCTETSTPFTMPVGPVFGGTAQLPPADSVFLPSTTLVGSYIVPGGRTTNVETFITSDAGANTPIFTPITATLYWTTTSRSVGIAPSRPFDHSITMIYVGGDKFVLETGGGSGSPIPAQDGLRVWYYIDAIDSKGNTNSDPATTTKAYTYDQTIVNPCANTPKNPAALGATSCAGFVQLSWSPVTQNTDNTTITDLAGYKVYRYTDATFSTLDGGFPVTVGPVVPPASPPIIYSDGAPVAGHYYKVTAFDTCSPGANESAIASAPSVVTPVLTSGTVSVTASPGTIHPFIDGVTTADTGVYRVTIVDPARACNGLAGENLKAHACAASGVDEDEFKIKEIGDTGVFVIDSASYGGRDYLQAFLSSSSGGGDLNLGVSKNDTITIAYNGIVPPGDTCTPYIARGFVSVVADPCLDTPNAPTSLTGSRGTGTARMDMSWTAPTTNTDGTTLTDLVGYNIYRKLNVGGSWTFVGQVYTTSVTNYDVGVNLQTGGDFYFSVTAVDSCVPPKESVNSNTIGPF